MLGELLDTRCERFHGGFMWPTSDGRQICRGCQRERKTALKVKTMIEQAHAEFLPVSTIPADEPKTTADATADPEPYGEETLAALAQRYYEQGLYVVAIGGDGEGPFPDAPIRLIRLDHYRDLEIGFVKARQYGSSLGQKLEASERVRKGHERMIAILTPALAAAIGVLIAIFAASVGGAR